jgi:hypothetical protein
LLEQLLHANAGLRDLLAARDAEIEALRHDRNVEIAALRLEKDVENAELRAVVGALMLRVAELERQLRSGSDDSGTPTSKESIAAKARRRGRTQSPSGAGSGWFVAAAVGRPVAGRAAGPSRSRPGTGSGSAAPRGGRPTDTVPRLRE